MKFLKIIKVILMIFVCSAAFLSSMYPDETAVPSSGRKQQLDIRVDQIISDQYPEMKAYVLVRDEKGAVVSDLAAGLFFTRIDMQTIKAKTTVIPFSMTDESVDYTVLISNNGIMEGEPLDFQKNAVLQFADLLGKNDTMSLYTIGDQAVPVFENVARDKIDPALINGIQTAEVQPRIFDSMMNVLRKLEQKKTRRRAIIMISDGRDQDSRFTKSQLDAEIVKSGIPVYAVGLRVLSLQSLSALDQICDKSGGLYFYTPVFRNIPDTVKYIFDCITKCYIINYKVKSVKPDNQAHLLEVTVTERDAEGSGQKTFTAVKLPFPKWLKILLAVIAVLCIALIVVFLIVHRIQKRKSMGITGRRCPDCGSRMKDSWDYCPFCRYMPEMKKKKKKDGDMKFEKPKAPKMPKVPKL